MWKTIQTVREFHKLIGEAPTPLIVVEFWASWCRACLSLNHDQSDSECQTCMKELTDKFVGIDLSKYLTMRRIDVDMETTEIIKDKYEIMAIPTYLFFLDGKKIEKIIGNDSTRLKHNVKKQLKRILRKEASKNGGYMKDLSSKVIHEIEMTDTATSTSNVERIGESFTSLVSNSESTASTSTVDAVFPDSIDEETPNEEERGEVERMGSLVIIDRNENFIASMESLEDEYEATETIESNETETETETAPQKKRKGKKTKKRKKKRKKEEESSEGIDQLKRLQVIQSAKDFGHSCECCKEGSCAIL